MKSDRFDTTLTRVIPSRRRRRFGEYVWVSLLGLSILLILAILAVIVCDVVIHGVGHV